MTPEALRAEVERVREEHVADVSRPSCDGGGFKCSICGYGPCDAYRLAGALLAVVEIHSGQNFVDKDGLWDSWCDACRCLAPCPTVRAAVQEMEER